MIMRTKTFSFNVFLMSFAFYLLRFVVVVVVCANRYAESDSRSNNEPSPPQQRPNDGAICLNQYQVNADTIIRTQDSKVLGAKYLNETELNAKEDCLLWCCQVSGCNVAVFEEKDKGSCYLFNCGSPIDFKCKFTAHNRYTSAILDTQNINNKNGGSGQASGGWIPSPSPPPPADEHIVALKNLRHEIQSPQHHHHHHHQTSFDDNPDDAASVTSQPSVQQKVNAEQADQRPTAGQMVVTTTSSSSTVINAKPQLEATKTGDLMAPPLKQPAGDFICSHFQFQCRTSGECIAIYNACDGIPQCRDASDESSELGCPPTDSRHTLGQTTQPAPILLPQSSQTQAKSVAVQHKQSEPESELRVSHHNAKEKHPQNYQEPLHDHVQESQNQQSSQNYGDHREQSEQHKVAETKPYRGSNRYHEQDGETEQREEFHRNGAGGGTNTEHNTQHDNSYKVKTSVQHGTILYAPKEQEVPITDTHKQQHALAPSQTYHLSSYNVPADDSSPNYPHGNQALPEDRGHTNLGSSDLGHQTVDHSGRHYYDNMPTNYDTEHSVDSGSNYISNRYGSPPSRGGGYVREYYEGGYASPENEYQSVNQQEGQYADHRSLHPYHQLSDQSESQPPLNPAYPQNAYDSQQSPVHNGKKYAGADEDGHYMKSQETLGHQADTTRSKSPKADPIEQGYEGELQEEQQQSYNSQNRYWPKTYQQRPVSDTKQMMEPPERPQIHHVVDYQEEPKGPASSASSGHHLLKGADHEAAKVLQTVAPLSSASSSSPLELVNPIPNITSPPKLMVVSKPEAHVSNIKLSLVEMEQAERSSESSGAVLALTLGLSITGLLLVLVGCRLRMVRRRLRRGRSPYAHDADYLVNGMYL